MVRENTRVFKLSNNLPELVALVHALEFVLSQPSSLNFMICFDSMYAAHVVQQRRATWKLFDLLVDCTDGVISMLKYVGTDSRDLGNEAADALAKAGAREQWHLWW